MTKAEVIEFLGKSKRTVAQYVADGKLPAHYVSGPNGREARFERADVDRLKRDIDTPVLRAVAVPNSENGIHQKRDNALAVVAPPGDHAFASALGAALAEIAAAMREPRAPVEPTPWLTLDEAVSFSGLARPWLLKEALSGNGSIAIRDMGSHARGGRWRFHRGDLAAAE